MEVTSLISTVGEKLGHFRLMWSTDVKINHSLRRRTRIPVREGSSVGKRFGLERLETLQGCIIVVRVNHAIALFTKRTRWLLLRYNKSSFQIDC